MLTFGIQWKIHFHYFALHKIHSFNLFMTHSLAQDNSPLTWFILWDDLHILAVHWKVGKWSKLIESENEMRWEWHKGLLPLFGDFVKLKGEDWLPQVIWKEVLGARHWRSRWMVSSSCSQPIGGRHWNEILNRDSRRWLLTLLIVIKSSSLLSIIVHGRSQSFADEKLITSQAYNFLLFCSWHCRLCNTF